MNLCLRKTKKEKNGRKGLLGLRIILEQFPQRKNNCLERESTKEETTMSSKKFKEEVEKALNWAIEISENEEPKEEEN